MSDIDALTSKLTNLDAAIEDALRNEVAQVVKDALVESARVNVYEAYTPKFESRRNGHGGIRDPNSIVVEVRGTELIAIDTIPGVDDDMGWQQLKGGSVPSGRLADAIAHGMYGAPPRPFHEKAKEELLHSGSLEDALRRGLARQGIDASDVSFGFK